MMTTSGRLAAIRAVDVVQLPGIGVCFGTALVAAVTMLRRAS